LSLTYPHRKKSQGVRSGDLGGQSSNLFERPCITFISSTLYLFNRYEIPKRIKFLK